jgi:hypothetical protein
VSREAHLEARHSVRKQEGFKSDGALCKLYKVRRRFLQVKGKRWREVKR